jgi:hypothetical protein
MCGYGCMTCWKCWEDVDGYGGANREAGARANGDGGVDGANEAGWAGGGGTGVDGVIKGRAYCTEDGAATARIGGGECTVIAEAPQWIPILLHCATRRKTGSCEDFCFSTPIH